MNLGFYELPGDYNIVNNCHVHLYILYYMICEHFLKVWKKYGSNVF